MLPNTPGTLKFSDLYGGTPPGMVEMPEERDSAEASGEYITSFDMAKPAAYWVAIVGMLVAIRVLFEKGAK